MRITSLKPRTRRTPGRMKKSDTDSQHRIAHGAVSPRAAYSDHEARAGAFHSADALPKAGYRGGKKAFEYFIRQKIVKAVEAGCGDAEALLRTPKPVKSIYYDFKYYFDEYSYANCDLYVEKAIEDCGNNTLRKEFLRAKGWDAPDDFDINDEEE